jgi:hypothetical protein
MSIVERRAALSKHWQYTERVRREEQRREIERLENEHWYNERQGKKRRKKKSNNKKPAKKVDDGLEGIPNRRQRQILRGLAIRQDSFAGPSTTLPLKSIRILPLMPVGLLSRKETRWASRLPFGYYGNLRPGSVSRMQYQFSRKAPMALLDHPTILLGILVANGNL